MSDHERIQILDATGAVMGVTSRAEAEAANHATPNVLVFIFNSAGQVWVQLRPKTKKHYPGRWDISACGGMVEGELPEQSAARELLEETGLSCRLSYVETFMNVFPGDAGETRRRLSHVFIGLTDERPVLSDEVDEFRAYKIADLYEDLRQKPEQFIPSFVVELDKAVSAHSALSVGKVT